jgi:epoxyqueuosine reductase
MMISTNHQILREQILFQLKKFGATSAGIARVDDLKHSLSYEKYEINPYYKYFKGLPRWPEEVKSILVFSLRHKKNDPELDWWDPKPGGTPGNRLLIQIQKKMKTWLRKTLDINARSLPYKIEEGGIFLKDSAALAGIGIIGKNNLLLTPDYGACVRLRAMFLDVELQPTGPLDFDPCTECDKPCFQACPQNAFRNGSYEREYCQTQIRKDEESVKPLPSDPLTGHVRYCRACELSCPLAN